MPYFPPCETSHKKIKDPQNDKKKIEDSEISKYKNKNEGVGSNLLGYIGYCLSKDILNLSHQPLKRRGGGGRGWIK
jgi:hypothetical protein